MGRKPRGDLTLRNTAPDYFLSKSRTPVAASTFLMGKADLTQLRIHTDDLEAQLRARGIELGDRRLRQLAQTGLFPEPLRGEYEFLATLLGLIKHYHDLYRKKSDGLLSLELRKETAKTEQEEIKAARMKEEVEDVIEVERSRVALVVMIRQKLLALPSQASSYLACCDTQAKMETELERQIEKILSDLEAPAFAAKAPRPDPQPENGGREQPRPELLPPARKT